MRDPDLATDRRPDERLAVQCRTTAWRAAARLGARPGRGRLTFARLAATPLTLAPLALAPLAGVLAGCGAGAGDRTGAALTAVRFVAEPELRIGSVDGDPDQEFMWFRELVVGPDGRIITGHRPEQTIRIHTADGRLLRAFGGDGEGPGEIRSLGDMGLLGDTLWVFDSDNARFAYYDLDGNVIGHRNVTIDLGEGGTNPPRPQAHFSDGTIRGASPAWSHEVAAGRITETAILRVTESGEPIDTVAVRSDVNTTLEIEDPDDPRAPRTYMAQPYSDAPLTVISPYATEVVYVDRAAASDAASASFRVTRVTFAGDTLFSREYPYAPVPLDDAEVDAWVADLAERLSQREWAGSTTAAQYERWTRDALYVPRYRPPVSQALIGRDGTIWLRREPIDTLFVDWLILDAGGEPIGTVALPEGLTVLAAERGTVWGTEYDALDVPYIVRYGVRPAAPAADQEGVPVG